MNKKRNTNAKTEHSKRLRAESARRSEAKAIADGAVKVSVIIRREQGGLELAALKKEHQGITNAIKFLINFYNEHKYLYLNQKK